MKFLLPFLLIMGFSAPGKDAPKYPVSEIPEEMKTGMYAVIREKDLVFEINSIKSSRLYYHIVITILNSNAKNYAKEVVGYDKFRSVSLFKGTVYDADGNVVKKLKQSDIYDQSAFDGFSLYSDNRLKRADLSQGTYPYTVEFEYAVDQKLLFFIPDFHLYSDDEITIQKTKYTLLYPSGLKPRYKLYKIQEPEIINQDGKEGLTWHFENVKPSKFEKLSPSFEEIIPNIVAAPADFEFDNYTGNMNSWENFGKWINDLNQGRNVLPEATKQKIREITSTAKTNEDKAKILYEYLQNKTRYVSIQLGIGGFQPFDATVVDQTGYGDCKALSNYMVAMLGEVGVKANYVLIEAGDNPSKLDSHFSNSQFNHATVAVPNGSDTLWLECTSQTNPFGYQGTFTGNRQALMITESGAKVVNTLRYNADQNLQARSADVYVDVTGDAKAKVKTTYSGLQYENNNLNFILNNQYDDQKKWLQTNTKIPSFDIHSFVITNHKDKIPSAMVDIELDLKRFATVSGKRFFVTPNLMNRSTYVPEKTDVRKTNVVWNDAYTNLDTIRYHLPEGIYPEFLPEPIKIKSRFGEYEAGYQLDEGSLVYIRKMKMGRGEFPPESYKELIDFFKGVNKADNSKIVFLSKT